MIGDMSRKNVNIKGDGVSTGLANRFKAQVLENGKVVRETDFAPNLILENGMNGLPTKLICDLFKYCAIGSDATPTFDSSGGITATASGTTVTAGTAIFSPSHVGELLVFDQTHKAVITGYTDTTHVTIGTALTVSTPTVFTMYRINQTGLVAEVKRTNNYLTGSGNCGTTYTSGTYTHQRTFDFPIETGSVTYNEVGFSDNASPGANLNTRGIFAGAPISLTSGQQLRVIYYFIVTVSPISPRNRTVSISGWPALQYSPVASTSTNLFTIVGHGFTNGMGVTLQGVTPPSPLSFGTTYYVNVNDANTFYLSATPLGGNITLTSTGAGLILFTNTDGVEQLTSEGFSAVSTTGTTTTVVSNVTALNEPSVAKYICVSTDSTAISAYPNNSPPAPSVPTGGIISMAQGSYTSGSYTILWSATFSTTQGNSSAIRKIYVSDFHGSLTVQDGLCYLFNQPQQKSNLYTLTLNVSFTWDRSFS